MNTTPAEEPAVYTSYQPDADGPHGDWLGQTVEQAGATEDQMVYLARQRTQLAELRERGEREDLWLLLDKRDALLQMRATQEGVRVTNVLDQESVIESLNARLTAIDQLVKAAGLGGRRQEAVAEGDAARGSISRTPVTRGPGKRELQIAAILAAIEDHGFHAQQVPIGAKSLLRKELMASSPRLFGAGRSPFDDAWKRASQDGRLSIQNRDSFTSGR